MCKVNVKKINELKVNSKVTDKEILDDLIAHLKPGVTINQADSALVTVAEKLDNLAEKMIADRKNREQ